MVRTIVSRQQRRREERKASQKRTADVLKNMDAVFEEAVAHHGAGRFEEAVALYDNVLSAKPDQPDALHLKGLAFAQSGKLNEGVELIRKAIAKNGDALDYHKNLGAILLQANHPVEALSVYRSAVEIAPNDPVLQSSIGILHHQLGALSDAEAAFRRAVALSPDTPEAHNNLGNVLKEKGALDEAEAALRRAIALNPNYVNAYQNLGSLLIEKLELAAAIAALQRAISLQPDLASAHANLAAALNLLERHEEGAEAAQRAIDLMPELTEAHNNLGVAARALGMNEAAEQAYRRAVAIDPAHSSAHSNLIFVLDFNYECDVAAHQAERRKWHDFHARPLASEIRLHENSPDPRRKLRIGYVSADFRRHSAANAFGPMLLSYDRLFCDVVCYSNNIRQDDVTARFRQSVTEWCDCSALDDAALAAKIRQDGIDILVDLSGHSAGNRMLTFARKPAPVQVTAWGFANGTGLEAMDYFLTDDIVVPEVEQDLYAEQIRYLPSHLPYMPPEPSPNVTEAPVQTNGYVTFGSYNRYEKVSDATVQGWSAILDRVGNSKLIVKGLALERATVKHSFEERLREANIDLDRVSFLGGDPQAEHLAKHALVDLMLDTFPHGGGVSTTDALWMGVPVISLRGEMVVGRIGASALHGVGLDALVASNVEEYVDIASRCANDHKFIVETRKELRDRITQGVVGDPDQYVRAVEQTYREIWSLWCAGRA